MDLIAAALFNLGFFRILGMSILFPLSDGLIGVGTRIALAFALSFTRIDLLMGGQLAGSLTTPSIMQLVLEFGHGLLLGAPLIIVYHAMRMYGDLIESLRGHQMGLVIDPMLSGEEQPLSILLSQALLALLVSGPLFGLWFASLQHSYDKFPIGSLSISSLSQGAELVLKMACSALSVYFALLLPFALIIVVIECVLAIVSKLASGVSLTSEGYVIRMLVVGVLLYFQSERFFGASIGLLQAWQ